MGYNFLNYKNIIKQKKTTELLAFCVVLFFVMLSKSAFALEDSDHNTVGSFLCSVRYNFSPLIAFFNATAYIIAVFLAGQMGFTLVRHYSGDQNSPMVKAVAQGTVAGLLAALPSFIGTVQTTLFGALGGDGDTLCRVTAGGGGRAPLDQMMVNFVRNIYSPAFNLLGILAFTIGVFFVIKGLLGATKIGTDPRSGGSPKTVLTYVIIGSILTSSAPMLKVMLVSLFGVDNPESVATANILAWANAATGADMTAANNAMRAVLAWVQVIGAIAFIRGFLVMKNAVEGSGQATIAQGLTHIIGGVMAINIIGSLKMFDATFGTGLF